MADLKLFDISQAAARTKEPTLFNYEREIQRLVEKNMETFFGIRFVATEHTTGQKHKGRIDSLGLDENNCPVIVEYKLDSKENVINQGLFYLDWLMDHKADFELLCLKVFGKQIDVDWSNPRLLCIARDFTRYDDYAISQINRNIELIRYRVYDNDHLLFEQAGTAQQNEHTEGKVGLPATYKGISDHRMNANDDLLNLLKETEDFIYSLGDDVQKKELKYYYAYTRIQNFVCLEIKPRMNTLTLYLKVLYENIENPTSYMRDVSRVGHYGTGDTEVSITGPEELEVVKPLIEKSYNLS